jgi:hypothetical protein
MNLVCEKLTTDEIWVFIEMARRIRRVWKDRPFNPKHALKRCKWEQSPLEFWGKPDPHERFSDSEFDFVLECFSDDAVYPVVDTASNEPLVMAHRAGESHWRLDALSKEVIQWWQCNLERDSWKSRIRSDDGAMTGCGFGNLKAYGDKVQTAPIKPITLLFGKNSSGKSSFLHGLLMLDHAIKTSNLDVCKPQLAGGRLDLGGFTNQLRGRDTSRRMTWRCEVDVSAALGVTESWLDPESARVYMEIEFGFAPVYLDRGVDHDASSMNISAPVDHDRASSASVPLPIRATVFVNRVWFAKYDFFVNSPGNGMGWSRPEFNSKHPALVNALRLLADRVAVDQPTADDLDSLARALYFCTDDYWSEMSSSPTGRRFVLPYADGDLAPAKQDLWLCRLLEHEEFCNLFGDKWRPMRWVLSMRKKMPRLHSCSEEALAVAANESRFESIWELIEKVLDGAALWLRTLRYVGPHRDQPSDSFGPRHLPSAVAPESSPESDPWHYLARNEQSRQAVNCWLNKRFRTPYYVSLLSHVPWGLIVGGSRDSISSRFSAELRRLLDSASSPGKGEEVASDPTEAGAAPHGDASAPIDLDKRIQDLCIEWGNDLHRRNKLRQEIVLVDETTGIPHKSSDLGYGISQLVPVVVASLAQRGKTILIEQPELHLHPAMQCELADLFIEAAMGQTKNRFILETHSEHLILRLLRRIRETTKGTLPDDAWPVTPEDVAVVYAEPTEEGTVLHEMKITDDGDFDEDWPEGFFEERLDELF